MDSHFTMLSRFWGRSPSGGGRRKRNKALWPEMASRRPSPCESASRARGEWPTTEVGNAHAGRPREGSISALMLRGPTSAYLTAVLSYKGPYKIRRRQGPTSRTQGPTEPPPTSRGRSWMQINLPYCPGFSWNCSFKPSGCRSFLSREADHPGRSTFPSCGSAGPEPQELPV